MTRWAFRNIQLFHGSRGGMMIEALLVVMLLGLLGTAVLTGLQTVHSSGSTTERQSVAESIARSQMELVFSQPYQSPTFDCPLITVPSGYGVTCTGEEYVVGDPNIVKLVVVVSYGSKSLLTLEALRTNR